MRISLTITLVNIFFVLGILSAQVNTSFNTQLKKYSWYYCGSKNLSLKDNNVTIKFLKVENNKPCEYGYYYRFETNGNFKGSYRHKPAADSIRVAMLSVNAHWKCFGDTVVLYSDWPLFYYKYKVISFSNDSLIITKIKSPYRKASAGYTPVILGDYWTTVMPKHWKFLPHKSVAGYPSAILAGIDTIYYSTEYTNRYYASPCVLHCSKLQIELDSNHLMSDKESAYDDTTTIRKNLAIKKNNDQLIKECPDCFNSVKKEVPLDDDKGVLVEPMLTGKGLTGYYSMDLLFGICIWGHNLSEENSKESIKMIKALERKY